MEWADEALILSVRPHGETAAIVEMFTRDHGRHLALVHGGRAEARAPAAARVGGIVDLVQGPPAVQGADGHLVAGARQ